MRWLTFAACAAVALILQTTLARRTALFHVRPDWVFAVVVFFALYCRRPDAYVAGWALGLAADLMSIERLGLLAVGYTLAAVMINAVRDLVFLKSPVTHFAVTLASALVLNAALAGYRILAYPVAAREWAAVLADGAATAVYTAVWAVPIHQILLKFSSGFGLHTSRYTHGGRADRSQRLGPGVAGEDVGHV